MEKVFCEYYELVEKINALLEPEFTAFGNVSFNRLSDWQFRDYCNLSDRLKVVKKEIRKEIGWWGYMKWRFVQSPFHW